jgi:exopolyphosphatase / guanosine-5'-triphosphate,3'-diphosphate pyrophosphatase
MHGYTLAPQDGLDFLQLVERVDAGTLKDIESVSEARRPLLAYGAIVLQEILRAGKPNKLEISALGVREGLLYECLDTSDRAADPLLAAARELNLLRSRSPHHGEELRGWTDRFFASSGIEETEGERRLRHTACLLADVGWRAHPDYRGEQSFNLIAYAAFIGIDHPGRAYLALSVLFRHDGVSLDKAASRMRDLAGPHLVERARLLAALMRIADPVSVAMAGILPRTPLLVRDGRIVLELPADKAPLASERLLNRMRQLGKLMSLGAQIEVMSPMPTSAPAPAYE